jgi:hypothetical protein
MDYYHQVYQRSTAENGITAESIPLCAGHQRGAVNAITAESIPGLLNELEKRDFPGIRRSLFAPQLEF